MFSIRAVTSVLTFSSFFCVNLNLGSRSSTVSLGSEKRREVCFTDTTFIVTYELTDASLPLWRCRFVITREFVSDWSIRKSLWSPHPVILVTEARWKAVKVTSKLSLAGHRWQYNTARALCIPDNWDYTHKAASTHAILLFFSQQQRFLQRAWLSRDTYIACLCFVLTFQKSPHSLPPGWHFLDAGSPKWNSALYSQFVKFRVLNISRKFRNLQFCADGNNWGREKATALGIRFISYRTSHRPNMEFCVNKHKQEGSDTNRSAGV